jgi:hypothetical protein
MVRNEAPGPAPGRSAHVHGACSGARVGVRDRVGTALSVAVSGDGVVSRGCTKMTTVTQSRNGSKAHREERRGRSARKCCYMVVDDD